MKPRTFGILLLLFFLALGTYFLLQHRYAPRPSEHRPGLTEIPSSPHPPTTLHPSPSPLPIKPLSKIGISEIISLDPKASFQERLAAVHSLGKTLTDDEVRKLQEFLKEKKVPDGMNPAQLHALKNDIVNALYEQSKIPALLAQTLLEIYKDPSQDQVMRDYAIQHLMVWYRDIESGDQAEIQKALWNALAETDSSIGGTALLALSRLSVEFPEFDRQKLQKSARDMVLNEKVGELSKITALQICAQQGMKEILPQARKVAKSNASIPLRVSAIAAIGTLGSEEDRPLLEKFANDDKAPYFQFAAKSALTRLQTKK